MRDDKAQGTESRVCSAIDAEQVCENDKVLCTEPPSGPSCLAEVGKGSEPDPFRGVSVHRPPLGDRVRGLSRVCLPSSASRMGGQSKNWPLTESDGDSVLPG